MKKWILTKEKKTVEENISDYLSHLETLVDLNVKRSTVKVYFVVAPTRKYGKC